MCLLTYARILNPDSKYSTWEHLGNYYEQPGFDYQYILHCMDVLYDNYEHYLKWVYEKSYSVVKRDTSVLYYDYTNFYFECGKEDDVIVDKITGKVMCSPRMEAISNVHDGSTDEIRMGYFTVEAAVLSKGKKMPVSVYEKVFSSVEKGFISATHENLCCLESLSAHFSKNCVRTLDRGFDGNDYYWYFLRNDEKFVIRTMKNRNVIYKGRTQNIMDIAEKYKGTYRMDFMDKRGKA